MLLQMPLMLWKKVRLRAFKKDASKIKPIPTEYTAFKNEIILERKLELSNESLRKTDLTRWGILYDHLMAEKDKLYQLARREGKYADVDVYRAYKGGKLFTKILQSLCLILH